MRSAIRVLIAAAAAGVAAAGPLPYFSVLSQDAGAWPAILSSIGYQRQPAAMANVFVARPGSAASAEWTERVERGAILIVEGESSLAEMFGFRRSPENVRVTSVADTHRPGLRIVWEKGLELPRFDVPKKARVFSRDRWSGAPLVAGFRRGAGAALWVAVSPGERGYERFPYLLQALTDLGMEAPFRSSRLWAFFDSAYRSRVDLEYFAARWRKAGVAALHVAAWHFYDRDAEQDRYLERLIEACHREGILVYAWLELPHVSERFWTEHPEWREKTASLQDAQLDWRKLMNLSNRECFRAVSAGVRDLLGRFDWDGVNLAELYFESLEGMANPARFTPMNDDVRSEFRALRGFDPLELFHGSPARAAEFLEYRAGLARRMQEEWLGEVEGSRTAKPYLDIVLTHVDDRFDTGMRDALGADAARVLPLLEQHSFTFLIEDPATVWHLGAQRYQKIAEQYRALTTRRERLAVDLNIVERYQDVYPTKQQTGTELFQLVHNAAANFARVALYFENSLLEPDLGLLGAAAADATGIERMGGKIMVASKAGVGIPWRGGALVDGAQWPLTDGEVVWLPGGAHTVEAGAESRAPKVLRVNADVRSARVRSESAVEFSYESKGRAMAVLDRTPERVEIDGAEARAPGSKTLMLPRGQHVVVITAVPRAR